MTYTVLKPVHVLGSGLIGVWVSDLRSRYVRALPQFAEAIRDVAVFCDGVVVPGARLLLASETVGRSSRATVAGLGATSAPG